MQAGLPAVGLSCTLFSGGGLGTGKRKLFWTSSHINHIRPKRFTLSAISWNHLHNTKSFPLSFEPFGKLRAESRPLPYNCLKIARIGCKNLTPCPTEERCRASSNRNSCYAIARNFFNGNYTKAGCISKSKKS